MEGLGTLFRKENPYEKRVRTVAAVAEKSGFARPLLYAAMGEDMAKGEQWDTDMYAQVDNYLKAKANIEAAKDKREAVKFQTDSLNNALIAADKIWKAIPGDERSKGQAVVGYINPILSRAGIPPLLGYAQDEHGQRSFTMVMDKDAEGSIITKRGYISNGKLFVQSDVDDKGEPVFKPATGEQMSVEEFKKFRDATKKDAPKTRTYQKGGLEVTEEYQPDGTWKEIGSGSKWNPKGEGSKEESRTTDMKELDVINADRRGVGQPVLSLEEYKRIKYELNDPSGIKELMRDNLQKKKGVSTITPELGDKPVLKYVPGKGVFQ